MTDRLQTWMSALVALAIGGCATRGGMELLETKLRDQEDFAADLEHQLASVRNDLKVARSEADAHLAELQRSGRTKLVSEQADVLYRAEAIKFNPLLTSGADLDGLPGDEALSVLLTPVDEHGELIKLVGALELEVLDLDKPREEQRVGFWSFTPKEVREHWHRGFMSGGYLFKLDWQQPPTSSELTLHGRMTAPDGRKFSATQQVHIKLPGGDNPPSVATASHKSPVPLLKRTARNAKRSAVKTIPTSDTPPADEPLEATANPIEVESRRIAPADDQIGPLRTSDRWTESTIPRLR